MSKRDNKLIKTSTVADSVRLESVVVELCATVAEALKSEDRVAVVGIRAGGEVIAKRLSAELAARSGNDVPLGFVDITLYRDDLNDLGYLPQVGSTEIDFPIDDTVVVLADDVIYTGRTVRAAIDEIVDFGRPKAVRLLAVAERDGRELPIQADYVGLHVETESGEMVIVSFDEPEPGVFLYRRTNG